MVPFSITKEYSLLTKDKAQEGIKKGNAGIIWRIKEQLHIHHHHNIKSTVPKITMIEDKISIKRRIHFIRKYKHKYY